MQAVTARPPNFYTTRKPFVHIPHICRDASIDAVTRTNDGLTYIFKGKKCRTQKSFNKLIGGHTCYI